MRAAVVVCLMLSIISDAVHAQRLPEQSAFRRATPLRTDTAAPQVSTRVLQADDERREKAIREATILGAVVGGIIGLVATDARMNRDCADDCWFVPSYAFLYVGGGVLGGAIVGDIIGSVLNRDRNLAAAGPR